MLATLKPQGPLGPKVRRQTKEANGDPGPVMYLMMWKIYWYQRQTVLSTERSDLLVDTAHTLLRQQIYLEVDDNEGFFTKMLTLVGYLKKRKQWRKEEEKTKYHLLLLTLTTLDLSFS